MNCVFVSLINVFHWLTHNFSLIFHRPNNLSTTKRNRQNSSHSKKRKYSKHSLNQGLNSNRNSYDPWRDIYQEDLFKGPSSSSNKPPSSYRTPNKETTTSKDYKGESLYLSPDMIFNRFYV